ncbi:MAG: TonB-dependent receptor, partial [Proteobacteria bacterium]|nr:TonB-dependent receptor [Pseudomonadota bacterium]
TLAGAALGLARPARTDDARLVHRAEAAGPPLVVVTGRVDVGVEGVDVTAQYHTEIGGGRLNVAFVGTQMLTKETLPVPSLPDTLVDCHGVKSSSCFTSPEWRHTATATYGMDDWSATMRWRYIGEVDYDGEVDTLVADGIDAQSYFDIVGQYYLGANTSFTLGINNFLDEEPPLMGASLVLSGNTEVGFYDTLGRMVFANVTLTY